jgi:enoyl-CoA hydratase/carnithine racemase
MDEYKHIRYAVEDGILTITLYRPEQLNAFSSLMVQELIDAFDRSDADDAVKCVIVTGEGRAFCAGADLARGADTWSEHDQKMQAAEAGSPYKGDGGGRITRRIFDSHKPVIAAINGPAVGLGLTATLAMDVRMAVAGAKMGFVFAARGIVPEACSAWFLPRIVGISTALEWCYSGRVFRAEEGLARGLLRSVHSPEELMPAARKLAREFADNTSAVSKALVRHMFWRMLGAEHPIRAHEIDTPAIAFTGKSRDAREGISAFLEKRPAQFNDRVSHDMPPFFPWWEQPEFEPVS